VQFSFSFSDVDNDGISVWWRPSGCRSCVKRCIPGFYRYVFSPMLMIRGPVVTAGLKTNFSRKTYPTSKTICFKLPLCLRVTWQTAVRSLFTHLNELPAYPFWNITKSIYFTLSKLNVKLKYQEHCN
jgi:hypothetical protein